MTTVFDDVRLPEDVENGAVGGPSFNTVILTLGNGVEQRNENWMYPRHAWDIGYGVDTIEYYQAAKAFFYARRGQSRAFRFKDWSDFDAELTSILASSAAGTQTCQLVKAYTDVGNNTFLRPITRIAAGTTLLLFAGSTPFSDFTYNLGLITLGSTWPGGALNGTFEFDVPVRFSTDTFSLTQENIIAGQIQSLPVIEVIENAYTLNGTTVP